MNRVCHHFEIAGFIFKSNIDIDKCCVIAITFTYKMSKEEKDNLCKLAVDTVRDTNGVHGGYFTLSLHDFTPKRQTIMVKAK